MNFKTTIVLLILLAGVGGYLFFTRDKGTTDTTTVTERQLVDVKKDDVSKLAVTAADGRQLVLEKATDKGTAKSMSNTLGGAQWRMVQPVKAMADPSEVSSLIDAITGLKPTAAVPKGDAPRTGLDKPQFKVELTANGKATTLLVGDKLAATGGMYVKVEGQDQAQVVPTDLYEKLDRPATALRLNKLVEASTADIQQLRITKKDGNTIALEKKGNDWEVTQPNAMPADSTVVSDLLFAVTGLRAAEWVEDPSEAAGLDRPALVVSYSTQAPSTQPTTVPATGPAIGSGVSIRFGGYDDRQKKNVYVQASDTPHVAKVAASSLTQFEKTPLDLRDKKLLDVNPKQVSRISIATDLPSTTQPTTRPASLTQLVIERKKKAATMPATLPVATAATAPATGPATTSCGHDRPGHRPRNTGSFNTARLAPLEMGTKGRRNGRRRRGKGHAASGCPASVAGQQISRSARPRHAAQRDVHAVSRYAGRRRRGACHLSSCAG